MDPTDAKFVDVIHSNAQKLPLEIGFGIMQPVGHVDFYPNGGKNQPGCALSNLQLFDAIFNTFQTLNPEVGFKKSIGCSHGASATLFTDSIKNTCNYTSYPCSSEDDFNRGNCVKCSSVGCNQMGYRASPLLELNSLYLNTKSIEAPSCCLQHYQVTVTSDNFVSSKAKGKVAIYFKTDDETSQTEILDDSNTTFESLTSATFLVSLKTPFKSGPIKSAYISYTKSINPLDWLFFADKWEFKRIEVFSGEQQTTIQLCPQKNFFNTEKFKEFKLCSN